MWRRLLDASRPTTTPFSEVRPQLAKEYFEIKQGECCLRKRCFVDFIHPESFDDIQFGSLLASKWVRHEGDLSIDLIGRLRAALQGSRTLSPIQKADLLASLDERLKDC
jgi:hypothetical protein